MFARTYFKTLITMNYRSQIKMEFAELIASPKIDGVLLHGPFHKPVDGTLCITGHHLILSTRKQDVQELWLLHKNIDFVEKKSSNGNSNLSEGGIIIIKCKDLRIIHLEINTNEEFNNVYSSIESLSNLRELSSLYPFFYRPMYNILEDGYTLFKPEIEYGKLISSDEWRLSNVNKDYSVCPTYGSILVVPKTIDDDTIVASAAYRDGGRFPMLSYRHENGAVLLRSSQPMVGTGNRRCRADERMLNVVLCMNKKGYIIDTRSSTFSNQCKAKGGGYELDAHYPQWKRIHKTLDKISLCNGTLLDSFSKIIEACNDVNCSPDKWISRVENSGWLTHVQNTMNVACLVAQCIDQEGACILVHGSNGVDSTLLVTSLAQVILNADCRTVRGLQALIDREWLQAGHPFSTRHAQSCYFNSRTKSGSQPTFLLFLDCVQQLHNQFPCSFEFTTHMLILLFEHSYFSQFGTFLGNCEVEREAVNLFKRTTSLWSYLNRPDILGSFLNPVYEPNRSTIWPSIAPISLVLWSELYLRWILEQKNERQALTRVQQLVQQDKNERTKATRLRKQLADLQREWDILNTNEDVVDNA